MTFILFGRLDRVLCQSS